MSVTAVPLRPIKKGSVAKLWIALGALSLAGAGLAYAGTQGLAYETTASGLQFRVVKAGEGASPTASDIALVHYTGMLGDGKVFDTSEGKQPLPLPVGPGGSIPGFSEGLQKMQKGGEYILKIPPNLAYGERGVPGAIPPNATLTFEVRLLDFVPQSALGGMGGVGAPPPPPQ
jgi:FKBP-type peptidyl-prolyl cis-trans isomerase FkpA